MGAALWTLVGSVAEAIIDGIRNRKSTDDIRRDVSDILSDEALEPVRRADAKVRTFLDRFQA